MVIVVVGIAFCRVHSATMSVCFDFFGALIVLLYSAALIVSL